MGKLLHSKTFRNNLFRWLFLYVGVLVVITSVVTYSRYITKASMGDNARPARFEITVEKGQVCSKVSGICGIEAYKLYDELEYSFSVDTSNLEVLTQLIVNISVNDDFDIIGLYEVTNQGAANEAIETLYSNVNGVVADNTSFISASNTIRLSDEIGIDNGSLKHYLTCSTYH